jgi:hypothetical protein
MKIITGCFNTPIVIADTNIEDSFDIQGYFIGKLPFDPEAIGKYLEKKIAFSNLNFSIDDSAKNTSRTTTKTSATINY